MHILHFIRYAYSLYICISDTLYGMLSLSGVTSSMSSATVLDTNITHSRHHRFGGIHRGNRDGTKLSAAGLDSVEQAAPSTACRMAMDVVLATRSPLCQKEDIYLLNFLR